MLARLGGAALLAGLLVIPAVSLAADADEGQTLDIRRLSPDQRRRLLAGETVIYAVPETTDVQLGAGVAMYLPVALARVAEMLTSPDLVLRDSSITASGPIPADDRPSSPNAASGGSTARTRLPVGMPTSPSWIPVSTLPWATVNGSGMPDANVSLIGFFSAGVAGSVVGAGSGVAFQIQAW